MQPQRLFEIVYLLMDRGTATTGELARKLEAVSYTHLDVYKRQPQSRHDEKPKAFHTPGCRSRDRLPPPMPPQSFTVASTVCPL